MVGGIWLTGLLIGSKNGRNGTPAPATTPVPPASPPPMVAETVDAPATPPQPEKGAAENQGGER